VLPRLSLLLTLEINIEALNSITPIPELQAEVSAASSRRGKKFQLRRVP
jgi:hypothetical protein